MTLVEKRTSILGELSLDLHQVINELDEIEAELNIQRQLRDEAKSQGDLSENAAYNNACEEVARLEGRKVTTTNRRAALSNADIPYEPSGFISVGSMVKVQSTDGLIEKSFLLVTHSLGNASRDRVAIDSDVGNAIVGRQCGENFVIQTQAKTIHYRILEVL